jgi:hypothetical protein
MSIWGCQSPASYCQPSVAAGFVYLEFSWIHAPFVFSSVQPDLPFAVAVFFFFYLDFMWGCAPHPVSSGACLTLATVGSLSPSKHIGGVALLLPSLASLFIYSSMKACLFPTLWSSGCPTLFATCLFFSSCLYIIQFVFFSFFSWVGVSLSRSLCWSGPGLFVGVPCAT